MTTNTSSRTQNPFGAERPTNQSSLRRRARQLLLGAAAAASVLAIPAGVVGAAPNPEASCIGKLTVFNAEYPEVFGTRADVAQAVKALTDSEGVSPGAFYSMVAKRSTPLEECV